MKKNFRISLKENNINLNNIVVLAAISNANQDNRLTIQEIASKIKMEQMSYPPSTDGWIVTVDNNFISIDKKRGEETINLLFIEEVEVFELVESSK